MAGDCDCGNCCPKPCVDGAASDGLACGKGFDVGAAPTLDGGGAAITLGPGKVGRESMGGGV